MITKEKFRKIFLRKTEAVFKYVDLIWYPVFLKNYFLQPAVKNIQFDSERINNYQKMEIMNKIHRDLHNAYRTQLIEIETLVNRVETIFSKNLDITDADEKKLKDVEDIGILVDLFDHNRLPVISL